MLKKLLFHMLQQLVVEELEYSKRVLEKKLKQIYLVSKSFYVEELLLLSKLDLKHL